MPDARVQAAIDHWAPRFVQAGVDYSDFVVTTAGVERWEDWHAAWCRNGDMHAGLAEEAAEKGRRLTAGEAWARATVALSLRQVRLDGGPRAEPRRRRQGGRRHGEDARVPRPGRRAHRGAARRRPRRRQPASPRRARRGRRSCCSCPGLDSTKEEFFRLENVFLDRGMATLSIDGPGQGESGYDLPIRPDYDVAVTAVLDAHRRPHGRRPRPRRPARREPRRLLRAAGARLRAAREGRRGPERAVQVQRHLGRRAAADARDVRGEVVREGRRGGACEGGRARPDRSGRAHPAAVPGDHRQARPPDPVGADGAGRANEAPNGEFLLHEDGNHGCANVPYKTRPVAADWLRERLG